MPGKSNFDIEKFCRESKEKSGCGAGTPLKQTANVNSQISTRMRYSQIVNGGARR